MPIHTLKISVLCALIGFTTVACRTTPNTLDKKNHAPIQTIVVNEVSAEGIGKKIGTITFQDSPQGLTIHTQLSDLPSGFHGFHIHEKGSCQPAEKDGKMGAAIAAGGHFNPLKVAHHGTPNEGHLGDLPVLNVDSTGAAKTMVIAPRLKLADVQGLAIMVHAGGDNYSDHPKPLGGGGDRIACGVIL
ncbi:superoxide dismutase family protein [Acinetobacter shaoyimingii]|uniref:Superoxide dismutase [Cu-Zn] n=1 Tax=Acinetobacter shaoyimingii TaxID=2715164 RepID=A0A6G8RYQ0_9GAMM|nr:superoxide dismutase family protein [Acinetobacter shaoyimingii]QIO06994.1 superoxide dismutase family protein [Acinetobacter shaoyimingii]